MARSARNSSIPQCKFNSLPAQFVACSFINMPLASRKLVLSHARSPISVSAVKPLKKCALFQQKKHLNLQKDSLVPLAARYPLSRAQALPPPGPPYGGFHYEGFRRLISAVDLGPLGRCGREAKEQKNGQQWDVED